MFQIEETIIKTYIALWNIFQRGNPMNHCVIHIHISENYLKIQKLALQNKQLKEIAKWQNDKIFDTYININNDFGDCDFFSNWLKK